MLLNSTENNAVKQEKVLCFNMIILKGFKERLPTPRPTSHIFFAHPPHTHTFVSLISKLLNKFNNRKKFDPTKASLL